MTNHPHIFSRDSGLYSHILFNKSPEQLRLLGARGGKAQGRNHRARRGLLPAPPPPPLREAPRETTAAAITLLDARFLWLRGAEKRASRNHLAGITVDAQIPRTGRGASGPNAGAKTR